MFDKEKLGYSFPPFLITLERGKIHELAAAIGDENPLYHDVAAAKAAGYQDIPLSPTGPTMFTFWGNTQLWEQLRGVGINVMRILHGEEEYEYLAPIQPGDTLTGVTTIVDGKSRRGKDGSSMDVVTTETSYTNQEHVLVLRAKTVFVVREPAPVQA
jgi:Acyl dehydratase